MTDKQAPTPAKFMKKPAPESLGGVSDDQLQHLAAGVCRRVCKLELEKPEGERKDHILAFLRAAAAIGKRDLVLASSMINYLHAENQVEGFVGTLVGIARDNKDDDGVDEFLRALKSNLQNVGEEAHAAFMEKVSKKQEEVWSS